MGDPPPTRIVVLLEFRLHNPFDLIRTLEMKVVWSSFSRIKWDIGLFNIHPKAGIIVVHMNLLSSS